MGDDASAAVGGDRRARRGRRGAAEEDEGPPEFPVETCSCHFCRKGGRRQAAQSLLPLFQAIVSLPPFFLKKNNSIPVSFVNSSISFSCLLFVRFVCMRLLLCQVDISLISAQFAAAAKAEDHPQSIYTLVDFLLANHTRRTFFLAPL